MHEITEAYMGGKIAQQTGIGSPNASVKGSTYINAHEPATIQPGEGQGERLFSNSRPTLARSDMPQKIYMYKVGKQEMYFRTIIP